MITMGNIFSYILQHKIIQIMLKNIKTKRLTLILTVDLQDQFLYMNQNLQKKKEIIYVYCKVIASQAIHEQKSLWINKKKIDEKGSNIHPCIKTSIQSYINFHIS